MIHYFFFLGFQDSIITAVLQSWKMAELPFVIQLSVLDIGMCMVLFPTIFVSKLIHTNRLLEKIILGKF